MTVLDFLRLTRASARPIIVSSLLCLALAALYTATRPVQYTARSSSIVVAGSNDSVPEAMSSTALAETKAATFRTLAGSSLVAEQLAKDTKDGRTPRGSFSAVPSKAGNIIVIEATSPTPTDAQELANAASDALATQAALLEANYDRRAVERNVARMRPLHDAVAPGRPSSPNWPVNLGIGLLAGILLGYLWGLLRKQIDVRLRHAEDAEELAGASVLAVIAESDDLANRSKDGVDDLGQAAEAMRTLRTNLRFVDVDNQPKSLVVTSANQGEGKSTIAANLARVLAKAGQPTVLVDGDLRRPQIANVLGLDPSVGLTELLAGHVPLEVALQETDQPGLRAIASGRIPPNPSELVGSQRMRRLLEELGRDAFVVLDAPPLLPVTDGGLLTAQADGAILVIHTGQTRKEQLELCRKILDQVGGRLFGVVMNRAPKKGLGAVMYGYGYGQGGYGKTYEYRAPETAPPGRKSRREAKGAKSVRRRTTVG
ncbi:polysaccharide biosynthesis tyrosine autokinase [Janibacter massiliensis]|uniref:polysaccharide biosynthesis tyrosine autokinase n=1 Tax=Janibacter massiliensis TaxID=2058291 RepID=UPI00131A517D|nr:polysaccharide biosynthesis tyrosine autokinase [Janibacter massiliensis]